MAGSEADHLLQLADGHVHLEPDLRLGAQRAREQQRRSARSSRASTGSFQAARLAISCGTDSKRSQTMRRPWARMVEPVSVTSTMASTRPSADLGLGGAPGELDLHVDAALGEPPLACTRPARWRRGSRAGPRAVCTGESPGHDEHPARRAEARLRVDQLLRHHDVGVVLEHPVAAGDAGVERAALDVARHLLRAHQQAAERRVVDAGEVAARRPS